MFDVEKRKYIDDIRRDLGLLTRGVGFIDDVNERKIVEFCNYVASETPMQAKIISIVRIGAQSKTIYFSQIFIPPVELGSCDVLMPSKNRQGSPSDCLERDAPRLNRRKSSQISS